MVNWPYVSLRDNGSVDADAIRTNGIENRDTEAKPNHGNG